MEEQLTSDTPPVETQAEPIAPPVPTPTVTPLPPAAKVVLEGTKTERELQLEKELKNTQIRASELEDENRRLKSIPATPHTPAPEKRSWLDGATFFE